MAPFLNFGAPIMGEAIKAVQIDVEEY